MLKGVKLPNIDYPSFKYLNINTFEYDVKTVNKVGFKRVCVSIPSCLEESKSENLEQYLNKFVKQSLKEVYVNFPYMHEAFPLIFEDKHNVYQIFGDAYTGVFKIHKEK